MTSSIGTTPGQTAYQTFAENGLLPSLHSSFDQMHALITTLKDASPTDIRQALSGAINGLSPLEQGRMLRAADTRAPAPNMTNAIANSMRGSHARDLTAGERTALQQAFGNSIDLSNVRIVNGAGWNGDAATALYVAGNPAITEGNTVYVHPDHFRSDFSNTAEGIDLLVHEFAHVRQYQQLGFGRFFGRYAVELAQYGKNGTYNYGPRNTTFTTETLEGQAQMAGDYASARWRAAHSAKSTDRSAAEAEIARLSPRMQGSSIYGQ